MLYKSHTRRDQGSNAEKTKPSNSRSLLKDISYRFPKIGVIKSHHTGNKLCKRIHHLRANCTHVRAKKNVLPKSPIHQVNSGHLPCGIFKPLYISLMLPPCELHSAFISCFQIRIQVCFNHDRNNPEKTMFCTGTGSQLCSVPGPVLRLRSSRNTLLMSFLISIAVRKLRFGKVENPNSALDLLQSVQKCSFVYISREFDPDSRNLLLLFRLFFCTFLPVWW